MPKITSCFFHCWIYREKVAFSLSLSSRHMPRIIRDSLRAIWYALMTRRAEKGRPGGGGKEIEVEARVAEARLPNGRAVCRRSTSLPNISSFVGSHCCPYGNPTWPLPPNPRGQSEWQSPRRDWQFKICIMDRRMETSRTPPWSWGRPDGRGKTRGARDNYGAFPSVFLAADRILAGRTD